MNTLYVGIDVSSADLVVCFMDHQGDTLDQELTVDNSLSGARTLEKTIIAHANAIKAEKILIGTESTSVYDLHIADFLASSDPLAPLHTSVFRINPRIIKNFKKSYADTDKTDPDDAFAIADKLRFGRLPHPYQAHMKHLPLQRLTRYRVHIVDAIRKETQCFLMHLFLKYNRFGDVRPFAHTMGATSIAAINDLSAEQLADMSLEELTAFVVKHSRNRCKTPTAIAQALKRAARESYRLRPTMAKSVDFILASIYRTIAALKHSLKELDKAIGLEFKAFPNTLISIKGIGPVLAAGIYAEIPDASRFPSDSKLAKFAGLTWRKIQSGNFTAEETRLTKTGSAYLRYYLVEAANSLRVHNEEYKAYYSKKFREVPKHRHKRALVLTARKLIRLVFALLTKKQLYDPCLRPIHRQANLLAERS